VREFIVRKRNVKKGHFEEDDFLQRHMFDVTDFYGEKAQLKLFDDNDHGYLMFDDFRTIERCNTGILVFFFFFFFLVKWIFEIQYRPNKHFFGKAGSES